MRRNGIIASVFSLALIGVGAAALVTTQAQAQNTKKRTGLVPVGEVAPSWTLPDATGAMHSLEDYRGKVVLMDYWATWCAPCKVAMPGLQALHEKFKDRGVVILGINTWENDGPQGAIDYMKEHKFTYGSLLQGDDVAAAYGVQGLPTIFVIGLDGNVILNKAGIAPVNGVEFETYLEDFLERYLDEHSAM